MSDPRNDSPEHDLSSVQPQSESDGALESEVQSEADQGGDADRSGQEIARLQEALLRLRAEMDNREKRAEREMIKVRKFALESLMRDFIQVLDSFDQALPQADEASSEGLLLTHKLALKVLADHGLKLIEPTGQAFDPSWHEAIVAQPTDEQAPDTVLDVLQKGYSLNDRLIRPARVIVAKAADA